MERFFDLLFSALSLAVLSPLFVVVTVVLRFSGEGEIFFLQERIGKGGQRFKLFKFATMLKNSPSIGTGTVTMKNDSRVLPIGKFLRKTKVNELPQLLNIFFGDMSVIGPRPLTDQTFGAYSESTQSRVKQVRPGLSGVGSIIFRAEEEILHGEAGSVDFYDTVIAPYKGALEEWFVGEKGLYLYFLCIVLTIWLVIFPRSGIAWKTLAGVPVPPPVLQAPLNYKR